MDRISVLVYKTAKLSLSAETLSDFGAKRRNLRPDSLTDLGAIQTFYLLRPLYFELFARHASLDADQEITVSLQEVLVEQRRPFDVPWCMVPRNRIVSK